MFAFFINWTKTITDGFKVEIIDHVIIDGNAVYEIDDQCMDQTHATQQKGGLKVDQKVQSSSPQMGYPWCLLLLVLLRFRE